MELKNDLTFFIEDAGISLNGELVDNPYEAYLSIMYELQPAAYYIYNTLYNLYDSIGDMFDLYIIKLTTEMSPSNADPIFCILVAEYTAEGLKMGVL